MRLEHGPLAVMGNMREAGSASAGSESARLSRLGQTRRASGAKALAITHIQAPVCHAKSDKLFARVNARDALPPIMTSQTL
jgi:hypothetical protein